MNFCRVIVDGTPFVNEDGFIYRIPNFLLEFVKEGCIVYIPFGKQNAIKMGFVIEIGNFDSECSREPIKEVMMIHHCQAIINENMMELCRFVANYYACAMIYCIKQVVPKYILNNAFVAFQNIETGERISFSKKNIREMAHFVAEGVYRIVPHIPIQETQEQYYALDTDASEIPTSWQKNLTRASKQRDIVQFIYKNNVVGEQLLKENFGNVRTQIKALLDKEFIKKVDSNKTVFKQSRFQDSITMTKDQQLIYENLLNQLREGRYCKNLINGVTGSGKTLIYENVIEKVLEMKRQVLFLVPEIALSYHLFTRLKNRFGNKIALLHSQLTERERYIIWQQVQNKEVDIVLGPRSALFLPFSNLGLIIIDEEHESSYKQSEPDPRYHAIKVSEYLGKKHHAIVLLGSATPSIDTLYDVVNKKCNIFNLTMRANQSKLPDIELVDMVEERKQGNRRVLSRALEDSIKKSLRNSEQVILLINKKGYSSSVTCHECGEVIHCPKCDIPLTYYQSLNELKCNYCEYHMPMVKQCPNCQSEFIDKSGIGTESVEEICKKLFPNAKIRRLDGQAMLHNISRNKIIEDYEQHKIDILVGTQLLAKGLDFTNTTCIGIINADITLNLPDFRSAERCYQLMVQMAGRAGRDHKQGTVFIQTYQKNHYALVDAKNQNIHRFFLDEISFRKNWLYPPIVRLCRVIVSDYHPNDVESSMNSIYNYIVNLPFEMDIIGPSYAPMRKKNNRYRMHTIIKAKSVEDLQSMMQNLRRDLKLLHIKNTTRVLIDIDPENIL